MKELRSLRANFLAAWDDENKLSHRVEVILIIAEPKYNVESTGEVTRQRIADQYRFITDPSGLREIAQTFKKLADEAESLPLSNQK